MTDESNGNDEPQSPEDQLQVDLERLHRIKGQLDQLKELNRVEEEDIVAEEGHLDATEAEANEMLQDVSEQNRGAARERMERRIGDARARLGRRRERLAREKKVVEDAEREYAELEAELNKKKQ